MITASHLEASIRHAGGRTSLSFDAIALVLPYSNLILDGGRDDRILNERSSCQAVIKLDCNTYIFPHLRVGMCRQIRNYLHHVSERAHGRYTRGLTWSAVIPLFSARLTLSRLSAATTRLGNRDFSETNRLSTAICSALSARQGHTKTISTRLGI